MQTEYKRSLDELRRIVSDTDRFFQEQHLDASLRNVVDLATEELFVNLVTYNTETTRDIVIEMNRRDGGVEVSLTDFDVEPFDPTEAVADVDVNAPLEDREPGGLGLYLVMKMVDSIHYEYRNRQSKITFTKHADPQDV